MFLKKKSTEPSEIFNRTLALCIFIVGAVGCARGFDDGAISGVIAQPAFKQLFKLDSEAPLDNADRLSTIAAMAQFGSIAGSLSCFGLVDWVGKMHSLRLLLSFWLLGVVLQITSYSLSQLLIGRFIAGVGIGMASVVCPNYLAEISPSSIRGFCSCVYSGTVYFGIMIGYFANWGTTLYFASNDRRQWTYAMMPQAIFASIWLIASLFVLESPRWLFKVKNHERALRNLTAIRHLSQDSLYLKNEVGMIEIQLARQQDFPSLKAKMKNLCCKYKYRVVLGFMTQILSQWSGANAVTMYAPEFFNIVGLTSRSTNMMVVSLFGVAKLLSALVCAFFVVDHLGRKPALYSGLSLQALSMLWIGIHVCVKSAARKTSTVSGSQPHMSAFDVIAVLMIYLNGMGWALGWNSVQYLINSEIFPLQVRDVASGLIMTFHFINQYGNSRAVPAMLMSLTPWGSMFLFAVVIVVGIAFALLMIPEIAACPLEEVDRVFERPWYKIGAFRYNHREGNDLEHEWPTAGNHRLLHDEMTERFEQMDCVGGSDDKIKPG